MYALGEPRDDEGVFVKMYPGDELRIPEGFGYRVGGVGDGMRVCLFLTMNHPASLVRHYLVPYTFRRLKGVLPEDYKSLHYTPKEDKDGSKEVTEGD